VYMRLRFGGHMFYAHLYNSYTPAWAHARVNKGFSSDAGDVGMQTDLINLEFELDHWTGAPTTLVGYSYLFDFNNSDPSTATSGPGGALAGENSSRASNKVFGVRLDGEIPFTGTGSKDGVALLYTGEFANQSNYSNGNSAIDANYYLGMLGLGVHGVKLSANYEILGSNDRQYAIQTPFATAFAMNGWADRIPGNRAPAIGLVDAWVQADAASPANWGPALSGMKMSARYHDFQSDAGNVKYGREFDFRVTKAISPNITLLAQYAIYWGDSEATQANVGTATNFNLNQDTQKAWLMGTFKF
ncbi:MAG: hypothetical protein L0H63_06885, partial [Nitrococcus sp.]|nr:hypothetical protein [Nitrococcus sp.]